MDEEEERAPLWKAQCSGHHPRKSNDASNGRYFDFIIIKFNLLALPPRREGLRRISRSKKKIAFFSIVEAS